jgi:hypothetical protein
MSNNIRSEINNDVICEAIDCYAKATTKVAARLGSEATIFLFLCDKCKPKFTSTKGADGHVCDHA